ncbi:MAG: DUF262 domain-containing protein [Bacteroidaceae bacterium]|nr:DUF262 domain-containing protein [Bacteroidaceae bacterium]
MKTLNINMIPKSPVKFSTPCTLGSVKQIAEETMGKYDYDVYMPKYGRNLQRELVWSLEQKQAFVISMLQRKSIPAVSVNYVYEKDTYEVIDGKQRLTTAVSFYRNEFPIVVNGEEFYYKDFEENLKVQYKLTYFDAYIHYDHGDTVTVLPDEKKVAWFLYVNASGTPQQDEYLEELKNIK